MPININNVDMRGLANAAGTRLGNLNLPVPDYGAYGRNKAAGIMQQRQLEQQYAALAMQNLVQQQRDAEAMKRQQLKGQQRFGVEEYKQQFQGAQNQLDRQQSAAVEQAKLGQKQQELQGLQEYRQGQLGMDQAGLQFDYAKLGQEGAVDAANIQLEEQKLQQQADRDELDAMQELKEGERNKIGALGVATTMAAQQFGDDPEKYALAMENILGQGVAEGIISEEDANQMINLPPEQAQVLGVRYAALANKANDAARFMAEQKQQSPVQGIKIGPDGSIEIGPDVVSPEKSVKGASQRKLVETDTSIQQLETLGDQYHKDFMTAAGAAEGFAGKLSSWLDLGKGADEFIEKHTGYDPKEVREFAGRREGFLSNVRKFTLQFVKNMSGVQYSARELEMMKRAVISESDSPIEFEAKLSSMVNYMKIVRDVHSQVAAGGLDIKGPEARQQINAGVVDKINSGEISRLQVEGPNAEGRKVTKTIKSEQIPVLAEMYGMTVEEFLKESGVLK